MAGNLTQVVTALTSTTVPAGGNFSFASHAANIGNASTGSGSVSRIYLSVDPVIEPLDTLLAIQTVPILGAFQEDVQNFTVSLPANLPPGTYYIGGLADYYNQIAETNETDNNGNRLTITVTAPLLPNLTEYVNATGSTTIAAGTSFSFSATTVNIGSAAGANGSTARIFLSVDPVITPEDTLLTEHVSPALGAAGNTQNFSVTLPANLIPGTYYVGGLADYYNQVGESNEIDNNANRVTITVTGPPAPNLTHYVTAQSSMTAAAGGTISFASTAVNIGNAAAGASTSRVYLSSDPVITVDDTVLAIQSVGPLAAGAGSTQNYTVTLPTNLAFGTYYIGGLADFGNQVGESNEGDNNANRLTLTILPPNLTETVTALSSTTVQAGGSFSFTATTSNGGSGRAESSTSGIYLSTDPTITSSDTLLMTHTAPALASAGSSGQNYTVNLPSGLAGGTYYIGGIADIYGQVAESNEGDNNNNYIAITVPAPPTSAFNISVNYSGDPTYQQYFTAAAARWAQVITGDLPDVNSAQYGFIDDLLIQANIAPIDGVGGILGQAGPDARRSGANGLPYHGTMTFDSADVASMVANGTFQSVVLHEMGHVLGIGSLWSTFGLSSGSSYFGANAVNAYRQLTGNNALTSVPLETTGGAGTANVHWSEAVFNTELMTGYSEAPGVATPLSILTIGGLQDLGYQVNYGAADPYALLVAGSESAGGTSTFSGTFTNATPFSSLQGEEGGRDVALTMDEANSQLSEGIAGTMCSCPADPIISSGSGSEAAAPPLVPTAEQLKHV